MDGVFGLLTNVVWTSRGPCAVDGFEFTRAQLKAAGHHVTVFGVDKFPRMVDYVIPSGVRIADADRVRLGAHLASGTTVMHEGFVNYNAGTLGTSMVEGRISAGVVVGDGSDVGGGASIMGTLSGGGKEVISIGERCLLGANSGIGISLGNDCVVEAGCYVTAGTKVTLVDERKDREGWRTLGCQQRAVSAQLRDGRRRSNGMAWRRDRAQRRLARQRLSSMNRGTGYAVAFVAAVIVATGTAVVLKQGVGPVPDPEECRAEVGPTVSVISTEQAENAALIAAISVRRGMPPRAASIALATAFQESKLSNIDYGDRDSLGLFQQRPSQGWGTRKQIMDPEYSINAFYDALERIDGYENMRITEAAQEVQRSGFPEAYQDHAGDARALASALTGETSPAAFSCVVRHDSSEDPTKLNDDGLTKRAEAVRRDLEGAFGDLALGGFEPGGATSGHMEGSAHYEGRALDVFVRPISEANNQTGWAIASYLVANAKRLRIEHVIFDDQIWTAGRLSEQGWRNYEPPAGSSGDQDILEHRDHVHVDVVG